MNLDKSSLEKIQRKLDIFIENKIKTLMPNLLTLANDNKLRGAAAGFAHIFVNNLGVLMKSEVMEQFNSMDNESKVKLRNFGIRFGYKTIYDATLLKPEASRLRIALFNVFYAIPELHYFTPQLVWLQLNTTNIYPRNNIWLQAFLWLAIGL